MKYTLEPGRYESQNGRNILVIEEVGPEKVWFHSFKAQGVEIKNPRKGVAWVLIKYARAHFKDWYEIEFEY